jgi:hypothetical protein
MADQVEIGQAGTGTVAGARLDGAELSADAPGTPGNYEPYHGRTVSWVAVSIIVAGFLAGGLAMVFGPTWWLFWSGGAVALIGTLLAASTNIFEDWY